VDDRVESGSNLNQVFDNLLYSQRDKACELLGLESCADWDDIADAIAKLKTDASLVEKAENQLNAIKEYGTPWRFKVQQDRLKDCLKEIAKLKTDLDGSIYTKAIAKALGILENSSSQECFDEIARLRGREKTADQIIAIADNLVASESRMYKMLSEIAAALNLDIFDPAICTDSSSFLGAIASLQAKIKALEDTLVKAKPQFKIDDYISHLGDLSNPVIADDDDEID
jgi:hypothetical protein